MQILFNIPDKNIVNYIERANIRYWGRITFWNPETLSLTVVEDEGASDGAVTHEIAYAELVRGIGLMLEQGFLNTVGGTPGHVPW